MTKELQAPSPLLQEWVIDRNSNKKWFMLYARGLSITWSNDPRYWEWVPETDQRGTFEVAVLKEVWWFDVRAKFDTEKLTPDTAYEVSFIVMLKDSARGWDRVKPTVKIEKHGKAEEKEVDLMANKKLKWIKIPVGEVTSIDGEIKISMSHIDVNYRKEGIDIKSVLFKPKGKFSDSGKQSNPPF